MASNQAREEGITQNARHKKLIWAGGIFIIIACFALFFVAPTAAQSYSFSVPELKMQVFVQPDASARIIYDILFENSVSGPDIEIVDIGTPHANYDIGNMTASLDGVPLTDIRDSTLIDTGVEIHLHDQSIKPGDQATLHFEFSMPDMVYQDTTNKDLASLQITPTWFDPASIIGPTDIWVVVHMLPEVTADSVLYQQIPFTDKVIFDEHVVTSWHWPSGDASGPNLVGVSFPQAGMTRVVKQNLLELTEKWLIDNPGVRFVLGAATVVLFAITFFRFTGGTGISVFVILTGGIIFLLANSPIIVLITTPLAIALFALNERALARRKMRYLPAIAQVEGGGIKRGLTAPEAAVLLEIPLNKVLALIIFGLLEKSIIRQVEDTPLRVEVVPEFRLINLNRKERKSKRVEVAKEIGTVVRSYEHTFLDLIEENDSKAVKDIDFSEPMKRLIQHTADRIKGFDLSDTQDYYKKIIERAIAEASSIGDIPEREHYIDRHLQWLLLDERYPTILTGRRYHYRPIWVRPFASSDRIGVPGASASPTTPSYGGKTSFGDVAASFAGWTENTMGSLASSIAPGSLKIDSPSGVVNLSGADRVTGDIFKALASSSGSGRSGGGGGCACACAGCACACACAGGGR